MVGERIAALRALAGLERPDLEHLADLSRGHVWLIEDGRRKKIEADTASRIARVFGVSIELLLGEDRLPGADDVQAAVARAWKDKGPRKPPSGEGKDAA